MKKMPVLFIGHGSPMNMIETNPFTKNWSQISQHIPDPKGILCISAHWYLDNSIVSSTRSPETIHDFYGFPRELYEIEYSPPGAPELAERTLELLGGNGQNNPTRGLDHGVWSVLHFMYPHADIPVCQLSVHAGNSPRENYLLGQSLHTLRKEGILILGSGNIVHNLQRIAWDLPHDGYSWADKFDASIKQAILDKNHNAVVDYQRLGSSAQLAFHYRDHFDPLLYVLGATEAEDPVYVFNDARVLGSVSMTSYLFGSFVEK